MKVFISYSSKDENLATELVEYLEASGLNAWYTKREVLPGDNWAEKTANGLKESDAMVILVTPAALNSDAVLSNFSYALGEKAFSNRVIPVIVGDAGDFATERMPWIFSRLKTVKLPKDGKNKDRFELIAHILKEAA